MPQDPFANGWRDKKTVMMASLRGFKRASADGILTRFAGRAARIPGSS
ncbi:porphobilinogen synthase [Kushneria avicenniae]|uniref:Delta-aminolevulinic acid dehydratase n=1 Tax=Kushneria avicenniae TaxID=402385 RepID=A0A1I1HY36_9GAMM|nr:porphobilinogen synthase [Kushneria avicenniae]